MLKPLVVLAAASLALAGCATSPNIESNAFAGAGLGALAGGALGAISGDVGVGSGAAVGALLGASAGAVKGCREDGGCGARTTTRKQYYDERAGRYYFYDGATGRYLWEDGTPRQSEVQAQPLPPAT